MGRNITDFRPESKWCDVAASSTDRMRIWLSLVLALAAVAFVLRLHPQRQSRSVPEVNSLVVIAPYKYEGAWVSMTPGSVCPVNRSLPELIPSSTKQSQTFQTPRKDFAPFSAPLRF